MAGCTRRHAAARAVHAVCRGRGDKQQVCASKHFSLARRSRAAADHRLCVVVRVQGVVIDRVLGLLWDGVIEEDDQGELTYARREDEASGDDSSGDEDYDDATAVDGTDMLDGLSLDDLADD